MRICVYGAGAIGGNFATRLAAAGNEVSVVVRGADPRPSRSSCVDPAGLSDRPADGDRSIVRASLAFARAAGLDTPTLDAIEAICVQLATSKGLYREQ